MLLHRHCFGKQRKGFPSCLHLNQSVSEMLLSCLQGGLPLIVMYVHRIPKLSFSYCTTVTVSSALENVKTF